MLFYQIIFEKLYYNAIFYKRLSVSLTECLRFLRFHWIELDPCFDWTNLKNLTKLHLDSVNGINVSNFIEFFYQRPKLEIFCHSNTFDEAHILDVFQALAEHCGNTIRFFEDYSGDQNYNFISGLKSVKEVSSAAGQLCCGDLFDPIKRLAEINTIERLQIRYQNLCGPIGGSDINCIFRQSPHGLNINPSSNLKSVSFSMCVSHFRDGKHLEVCDPLRLFTVYSSQILSNVEILALYCISMRFDWNLIRFAPKLRQVIHKDLDITSDQARNILLILETILQNRRHKRTDSDVIEVKIGNDRCLRIFTECLMTMDQSNTIKLSKWSSLDRQNFFDPMRL